MGTGKGVAAQLSTMSREDAASTEGTAGDHPVLLFDGVCNLCTGSVQYVIERDPDATFRFAPLQSEVAGALLEPHDVDPDDLDTVVLVEEGRAYTKSDAALRVARDLEGPSSLLRHARFVPRIVRDAVYDIVAALRYDVFGRKSQCMVPSPDVRERFLETSG
jgi:predicted DCC family thiol-disulfide oxidoreductase YuxK